MTYYEAEWKRADELAKTIDIGALRTEAVLAADAEMVAICDRALAGDVDAIGLCKVAVDAARASED